MRWRCLAVAAALLAAARPAEAGDDTWREQSERTIEVRGFSSLEIRNARGRVELLPSPDGRLRLTALKIVRVGNREDARELAREIVVEAGARSDRYQVQVRYPQRRALRLGFFDLISGAPLPRYEVRIAARVPRGLPVSVRETSGDIRSEQITGPQALHSTSGDIEIRAAGGPVQASTTSGDLAATGLRRAHVSSVSGDLTLREVAGPLAASTSSGDITVSGAADSLGLSSVSGDIQVDRAPRGLQAGSSSGDVVARDAAGAVKVSTASGDVTVGLREPLRRADVSTSSGEIRVRLDPAVRCALELRTSSGSLDVSLPLEMRTVSRRTVAGTVRGGTTPVVLHSASGDISVAGGGP